MVVDYTPAVVIHILTVVDHSWIDQKDSNSVVLVYILDFEHKGMKQEP
ncbi:hypothetical protein KSX_43740 [Ktedonospora formicarum]|uniref:Uncharacterized protein n=1 Tax=Ktedonospora formicarum TaxID=2778364 RepID=A0A8J3MTS1_9CHLR|nr:hypothetical protein KSX_43740 [Ktedonospora formicarum]